MNAHNCRGVPELKIIGLADPEVETSLRDAGIGMSVAEARSIAEVLGRDPSLTELYCYDAMWSEPAPTRAPAPH